MFNKHEPNFWLEVRKMVETPKLRVSEHLVLDVPLPGALLEALVVAPVRRQRDAEGRALPFRRVRACAVRSVRHPSGASAPGRLHAAAGASSVVEG